MLFPQRSKGLEVPKETAENSSEGTYLNMDLFLFHKEESLLIFIKSIDLLAEVLLHKAKVLSMKSNQICTQ